MLRVLLLAFSLLLPVATAVLAADGQPPPNDDGKGKPHDCDHRQEQQTS